MTTKTTLETFFSGKFLRVPEYQRDYAWDTSNIDDLFEDLADALQLDMGHYIGTFILARKPEVEVLDLVDGQQRLTSLTMLLRAFIDKLDVDEDRIVYKNSFLSSKGKDRLVLLGGNHDFFQALLAGSAPEPATRGQRRLAAAHRRIGSRVDSIAGNDPQVAIRWLEGVKKLQVLEFIEDNAGSAIRTFQTVNDRGQPLTVMEKIKSFLVFASSKYLRGELDDELHQCFGRVFRAYDAIKELGGKEGLDIETIGNKRFTEDNILRYHYLAYRSANYDWKATPEVVLEDLKATIKVKSQSLSSLRDFLSGYAADLAKFFEAFLSLLRQADSNPRYFKLFTSLGLSAALYPLVIRLAARDLLEAPADNDGRTMLDYIEIADLRVYKTRGTSPEKDICLTARDATTDTATATAAKLRSFIKTFMNDDDFRAALGRDAYNRNYQGVRHILIEWDESVRAASGDQPHSIDALKKFQKASPTVDHVLAQELTFELSSRGFSDLDDREAELHRIGNLTLVEKSINSSAQDKTPEQKASAPHLYPKSDYVSAAQLAAFIAGKSIASVPELFNKGDIAARTTELVGFSVRRWAI